MENEDYTVRIFSLLTFDYTYKRLMPDDPILFKKWEQSITKGENPYVKMFEQLEKQKKKPKEKSKEKSEEKKE